jgi:SAM-dependent methyltransferase
MEANPFDRLAPFYDSWFELPIGTIVDTLERNLLFGLARPRPGECVLDVGTGTGHFARYVVEDGATVIGTDLSWPMLREAAGKLVSSLRSGQALSEAEGEIPLSLVQADATALPFRYSSAPLAKGTQGAVFDLVLSVTMLEFVRDPQRAIDEMWSAVKPGGRLVVAVLNAWSPWALRREAPYDQAHLYSPIELQRLLGQYGKVTWGSAVFFLPNGWGSRQAWPLERIGRRFLKPFGALLVGRVDK